MEIQMTIYVEISDIILLTFAEHVDKINRCYFIKGTVRAQTTHKTLLNFHNDRVLNVYTLHKMLVNIL